MLRLGKINVQGGFHFTFRCKFWAGWAAPGRQQNLGGTAAPENEMVDQNPYNTWFLSRQICLIPEPSTKFISFMDGGSSSFLSFIKNSL